MFLSKSNYIWCQNSSLGTKRYISLKSIEKDYFIGVILMTDLNGETPVWGLFQGMQLLLRNNYLRTPWFRRKII